VHAKTYMVYEVIYLTMHAW